MASIGSAAAQGLESGFGLGLRARQQTLDEEERKARAAREAAAVAERAEDRAMGLKRAERQDKQFDAQMDRQRRGDARQQRLDELKVLDSEFADLQTEGSAMWQQFGGYDKVPEDARSRYTQRARDLRKRRQEARRAIYDPDQQEKRRRADEVWSRIEVGQARPEDISDDDLYETIAVKARRPMAEFLRGQDGSPSKIEQAALDLEAGMQTGNSELTLRAANVLLAPELRTGVGKDGPDGNEIIDKRIVQLVPHPQDPSQFLPVVEVTVRRDDGATGKYRAPITEGRGVYAGSQEMPKTLSMRDALDRVGQLSALAGYVNRPDVRKRLDKATTGKASAEEFLAELGGAGVVPPKPEKISRERVDLGNVVVEREVDASGRVVGEKRLAKGLAPSRGEGATASERDEARFDRNLRLGVQRGDITDEEAKDARRRKMLGTKPAVEDKPLTESQAKANLFSKRMSAAEEIIDRVGTDYSPMAINAKMAAEEAPLIGGLAGMAGNAMLSENDQLIEQAQRDFINAVLRRESGAVISPAEFKNARKQYFPQPGDDKATRAQKQANRRTAIEGMVEELPSNRRPAPRGGGGGGSWDDGQAPIAVNPKTGERLILRGGKWEPLK
jgi:hypothetical protein